MNISYLVLKQEVSDSFYNMKAVKSKANAARLDIVHPNYTGMNININVNLEIVEINTFSGGSDGSIEYLEEFVKMMQFAIAIAKRYKLELERELSLAKQVAEAAIKKELAPKLTKAQQELIESLEEDGVLIVRRTEYGKYEVWEKNLTNGYMDVATRAIRNNTFSAIYDLGLLEETEPPFDSGKYAKAWKLKTQD